MRLTEKEELFRQVSFIAYYFHWEEAQILEMPHLQRRKYCSEISRINRKANGERKNMFAI